MSHCSVVNESNCFMALFVLKEVLIKYPDISGI